ncbi:MAG: nucleotidyltransferase family protein, partial [Anaerolineales bacterium]
FVQACLRARWEPAALESARALSARPGFDWEAVGALAQREGVAQLLHAVTREADLLPDALAQTLRRAYFQTARQNLLLFREIAQLLARLEEAGVPVIVLKGAALAEIVYANPAVRPMCDMDLLVSQGDLPFVLRTLRSLDYEITPPLAFRAEVLARKRSKALASVLEVHWWLFVAPQYGYALATEALQETALPFELEGAPALALGPESQLMHLCGHLLLHHPGESHRWLWLHDIAEVLVAYREVLDWDRVREHTRRLRLEAPVRTLLDMIIERWQLPRPAQLRAWAESSGLSEQERLEAPNPSKGKRLLTDLQEIRGLGFKVEFLWRNLFPPFGYMREIYAVRHAALVPLTYPYRWFLALQEGLKGRSNRR